MYFFGAGIGRRAAIRRNANNMTSSILDSTYSTVSSYVRVSTTLCQKVLCIEDVNTSESLRVLFLCVELAEHQHIQIESHPL